MRSNRRSPSRTPTHVDELSVFSKRLRFSESSEPGCRSPPYRGTFPNAPLSRASRPQLCGSLSAILGEYFWGPGAPKYCTHDDGCWDLRPCYVGNCTFSATDASAFPEGLITQPKQSQAKVEVLYRISKDPSTQIQSIYLKP